MANEDLELDVGVKGTQEADKLLKSLLSSEQASKAMSTNFKNLATYIKTLTDQTQKLQAALSPATGGRTVAQTGQLLARGKPESFIKNSVATGDLANLAAQSEQITARITNGFATGVKNVARSLQNSEIVGFAKSIQNVPSTDLTTLGAQIIAQTARLANAKVAMDTASKRTSAARTAEYKNELIAKERLIAAEKELQLQQSRSKLQTSRETAVQRVTGDGGVSLFKIQAQLLINYGLMNQAFNAFHFGTQFVVELDAAFKELQAITATTATGMKSLSAEIIEVSQKTKFSAVEVAKAATILGQAGFSSREIEDSIGAVTLFATAVGSDLTQAVDLASSVITVFNLNASDMTHVADVLTGAINLSKLTVDKLALGIQYAGNTAAQMGITIEELTGLLGAMSNAGIKSGSTLGTGLRKLLTELGTPNKKLRQELDNVGLSIQDVNVEALGAVTVIENLKEAGFNAASAFKAFDVRAASAYLAISANTDAARELQTQVLLTNAAVEANEVQMESFTNSMAQLRNVFGLLINDLAGPFKTGLTIVTKLLTGLLQVLNFFPGLLSAIGTGLIALASVTIIGKLGTLIAGVTGLSFSLSGLLTRLVAIPIALASATITLTSGAGAMAALAIAARGLMVALGPIGLTLTALAAGYAIFGEGSSSNARKLDELKNSLDEAKGQMESTAQRIESVDAELARLIDRYADFKTNSEAVGSEVIAMQLKFGKFSNELASGAIKDIDTLIESVKTLRVELSKTRTAELGFVLNKTRDYVAEKYSQLAEKARDNARSAADSTQYTNPFSGRIGGNFVGLEGANEALSAYKYGFNKAELRLNRGKELNQYSSRDDIDKAVNDLDLLRGELFVVANDGTATLEKLAKAGKSTVQGFSTFSDAVAENNTKVQELATEANTLEGIIIGIREQQRQASESKLNELEVYNENLNAIDKLNTEINSEKSKLKGKQTDAEKLVIVNNIKKFREELQKVVNGVVDSVTEESLDAAREDKGSANPLAKEAVKNLPNITNDGIKEAVAGLIAKGNAGLESADQAITTTTSTFAKATKDYFDRITEILKQQIDVVKQKLDASTDEMTNKIAIIDAQIAEATDERGSLRGKVSDADVSRMNDQKKTLQREADAARLAAIKEYLPVVEKLVAREEELTAEAKKKYDAAPKNKDTIKEYGGALKDLIASQNEERALTNEQIALDAKVKAGKGELTEQTMSLGDALDYSITKYAQNAAISNDFGLTIEKSVTMTLDNATSAMGDFVSTVVRGTDSVGGAFKTMAISILESMLKIASNQVASSIFGSIFGAIGGSFFGSSAPVDLGGIDSNGMVTGIYNGGGSVRRAAAGYGVPNRDSVPIIARPGEYVLRNSAVDMIGKNNLDIINANGNRKIQSSAANMNQAPQQQIVAPAPVNVYVIGPEQKPTLGPKDIVIAVSEDMMKNGSTAKAVRSILR